MRAVSNFRRIWI